MTSLVILNLQIACTNKIGLPSAEMFNNWLDALSPLLKSVNEITIRIVDIAESQYLNLIYRGEDKPTNVLSFPFEISHNIPNALALLGDIIICRQLVENEAIEQKKTINAHWAHMVIHGSLHLLGYEHNNDFKTKKMEQIEIEILKKLGYSNPYPY